MKKFTLALAALATAAAAAWAEPAYLDNGKYVFVPGDPTAQATGMYLTITEGKLALTNDAATAAWDCTAGYDEVTFESVRTMSLGGTYFSINEAGAVALSTEETGVTVEYSEEFEGAYIFLGGAIDNPVVLANDLKTVDAMDILPNVWYCFEYEENLSAENIKSEIWSAQHPTASFIGVGGQVAATNYGAVLSVDANGALIHSNTSDMNAVWDVIEDWEAGGYYISNIATGKYLFADGGTLSDTPVLTYQVDSPVLYGAVGLTTNKEAADAKDTTPYVYLNARNNNNGVTVWSLDEGSSFFIIPYDEEQTDATIAELVSFTYSKSGICQGIYNAFKASTMGSSVAAWQASSVFEAETQAEFETAREEAIANAIKYAGESALEGFAWKQKSSGQYVTYRAAETPHFWHSNGSVPADCLWIAEAVATEEETPAGTPDDTPVATNDDDFGGVDDGDDDFGGFDDPTVGPEPSNEPLKFYIKNQASGKYVGKYVGVGKTVPEAETTTDAGVFTFTVTNYGLEFVVDGVDGQTLNININDSNGLVTYYEGDANAAFEITTLPMMSQETCGLQPTLVLNGKKELVQDEYWTYEQQLSITSVDLYMAEGCVATGLGKIALTTTYYDEDTDEYVTATIAEWDADIINNATPVDTTYVRTYFGFQDNDTIPCKLYSLILRNEITEPGTYVVEMPAYTFSKTVEGTTYFSAAGRQYCNIEAVTEPGEGFTIAVTPAEGVVTDLTSITLNSESGMAVNWGYAGEELVTLSCPGDSVWTINGDKMTTFDSFDWDDATKPYYTIPCNYTAPGTYTFTIPAGFFSNDNGDDCGEVTVVWTIEEQDGIATITDVKVQSNVIYDLSGRRVAKASKGIYIINGVKTLVK